MDRAIQNHLKPSDLEGAYRELRGDVVRFKANGNPYSHVNEVAETFNGLRNYREGLKNNFKDALKSGNFIEAAKLSRDISRVNSVESRVRTYLGGR